MKHFIFIIATLLSAIICTAQVPQGFSFQSLVLDENSDPVREQMIGVQVQILDESATGTILYSESHRPTTNSNGLYTIEIGNGDGISGTFEDIDWLSGSKYVALSHDLSGGTNYILVGSSQLLSVPYALASGTSFVAPKIYASRVNLPPTTFDITEFDAKEFISYRYEWIQGDPEDVYLEYRNLPANINIQRGSRSLGYDVISSNIDTINDGIVRPNSSFGIVDPNVPLVPGSYEIDLVFSTDTEILAELKYPLEFIDPTINETDCTIDYVGEKIITTACDSLSHLIGTSTEVVRVDNHNIIVRNFLNLNIDVELNFDEACSEELDAPNISGYETVDFVLSDFRFFARNGILDVSMELRNQGEDEYLDCSVEYR